MRQGFSPADAPAREPRARREPRATAVGSPPPDTQPFARVPSPRPRGRSRRAAADGRLGTRQSERLALAFGSQAFGGRSGSSFSILARERAADAPPLFSPFSTTYAASAMSLIVGDDFQHILRVLNTNVDGRAKVMYALTQIRGIGRRSPTWCARARRSTWAALVTAPRRRAGVHDGDSGEAARTRKIPVWCLNRQRTSRMARLAALLQRPRHEAPRRPRSAEEDPSRRRGLRHYGYPRARAAHEDHWPPQVGAAFYGCGVRLVAGTRGFADVSHSARLARMSALSEVFVQNRENTALLRGASSSVSGVSRVAGNGNSSFMRYASWARAAPNAGVCPV